MRVLVFDTETTGLPKDRNVPAKNLPNNWPHIVSISWVVLEDDVIVSSNSYIVKPKDWMIPQDSEKIHGISNFKAHARGHDLESVIQKFMMEPYDLMVAHNLEFDENVLVNAIYWDLSRKDFHEFPGAKYCSMKLSRDICKITSKNSTFYKSPKLSELYSFVFGENPNTENLHNSAYDVELLARIIVHCRPLREKLGLVKANLIVNNGHHSKISNILRL
jgi:DNA polymerase-3 subunit alpha